MSQRVPTTSPVDPAPSLPCVPQTRRNGRTNRVVVGVDTDDASLRALDLAYLEADLRGARLDVVHCALDIATFPAGALGQVDRDKLTRCIEECIAYAQSCTACADACLSEGMVGDLTMCIRSDTDCADIWNATASVLSRHTGYAAQPRARP